MSDFERLDNRLDIVNDKADENARQVSKLWTELRETQGVLWGDNARRDNGIRSDVRKLEALAAEVKKDFQAHVEKVRTYRDKERFETCPVKEAFEKHLDECAEREIELAEGDTEVKVAEIQANAAQAGARLALESVRVGENRKMATQIVVQFFMAVATILAVVLSRGTP